MLLCLCSQTSSYLSSLPPPSPSIPPLLVPVWTGSPPLRYLPFAVAASHYGCSSNKMMQNSRSCEDTGGIMPPPPIPPIPMLLLESTFSIMSLWYVTITAPLPRLPSFFSPPYLSILLMLPSHSPLAQTTIQDSFVSFFNSPLFQTRPHLQHTYWTHLVSPCIVLVLLFS